MSLTKPALALVAVTFALLAIARTTGSGWLVVLLAAIGAIAVLALVLPIPVVLRATVELDGPADATAGRPMQLTLAVVGTRRPVLVRVTESDGDWTSVAPPVRGRLDTTPARRGVVDALTVELRCGAPLGLLWWGRTHRVTLARPIEVGPAPIDVAMPPPRGADATGNENRAARRNGEDLVRGTRDYTPGDPIKTVHWAATAHHGRLMVRENEATGAPPLVIAVDMRAGGELAERAASMAAGLARAALTRGTAVTLVTSERHGVVAGEVRTAVEIGRRLARAVPGAISVDGVRGGRAIWVTGEGVRA